MLVDTKGVIRVLGVLAAVIALCALDLHCSGKEKEGTVPSTVARVTDELAAGRRELARSRADGMDVQLRELRLRARKLVREGKSEEARKLITAITQLEKESKRTRAQSEVPVPSQAQRVNK